MVPVSDKATKKRQANLSGLLSPQKQTFLLVSLSCFPQRMQLLSLQYANEIKIQVGSLSSFALPFNNTEKYYETCVER